MLPVGAAVIGPVETALAPWSIGQRVESIRSRRRHGEADAPGMRRESVALDVAPMIAAIVRDVQTAAGAVGGRIHAPRRPARLPQSGIDRLRIAGPEGEIHGADVGILVEDP